MHGFWQAAWTWDERVMPALAEKGYHCLALSLRGHGSSRGKLRWSSISDYVEDVVDVAMMLAVPPVIVGHSMGAFTVQHYLAAGHPASGVIMVSPATWKGTWGATTRVVRRHPLAFLKSNLILDVGPIVETPVLAHDFLVSRNHPVEELTRYTTRLERASYRAYLDMLLRPPDMSRVDVPAVVVGGSEDAFFSERGWADLAKALRAELVVLDGIGHQPMWEGSGEQLVTEITRFVDTLDAADPHP